MLGSQVYNSHLKDDTNAANVADMVSKNRQSRGDVHPSATITSDQARRVKRSIFIDGLTPTEAARCHAVKPGIAHHIAKETAWKHITV